MSLLQEIRVTAVGADTDIVVLLRQCKVLAACLDNQEFKQWVDWELNGYPSTDVLPSYRVLNVQSFGHFVGPLQSEMNNVPLPPSFLPEKHRHLVDRAYLVDSISVYSSLVKEADSGFKIAWPADAVAAFGEAFYEHMHCVQAWRAVSRGSLAAVIDAVRNRVLSFALDLEAEDPQAGDVRTGGPALAKERVLQMFNQQIRRASRVFIGHGRAHVWKDLRQFVTDRLHLECDEFNREPAAGRSTKERLQEMLDGAVFAFLVMTGEDDFDGTVRARENVVHEVGLFQGRLGFEKAIILLEEGCSKFSNIEGLTYIPFQNGDILSCSEEIRRVLEREGILRQ